MAGRKAALVCVCLAMLSSACRPSPKPTQPKLCFLARAEADVRPFRPGEWVSLITTPQTFRKRVFAERDCTGAAIDWEPPPSDCIVKSPLLTSPEPTPLNEADVYERMVSGGRRLVWLATHHFANGEGFGPIALVKLLRDGAEVVAIGSLRLRTERVSLELWTIGGNDVVVASGETCTEKNNPSSCHRAANVLVHHDRRLLHPTLTYQNGRCIDEPWVELRRSEDLPLKSAWNRHFEIVSTLSHDLRYLVITEQVVVHDSDPNAPNVPPREVRRIDTDRFIHVVGPRLVTRQHPLWPRILPSSGSTELRDPDSL